LDSEHAFSLLALGDLENVVFTSEWILLVVDGEGKDWEVLKVRAVFLDGNSTDQWVSDFLWSDKEGSSGVDDSHVLGGINLLL
jgi:hypothetical protein